jgi:hypothetical protein
VKRDEVIDLAEEAALMYRRLVEEGVPLERVSTLVSAFLTARVFAEANRTMGAPKEPWEEERS